LGLLQHFSCVETGSKFSSAYTSRVETKIVWRIRSDASTTVDFQQKH
jgi:hypothetical protein